MVLKINVTKMIIILSRESEAVTILILLVIMAYLLPVKQRTIENFSINRLQILKKDFNCKYLVNY